MSDAMVPGMTPDLLLEAAQLEEAAQTKEWRSQPERIAAETATRPERIEQMMAKAQTLFSPESWEQIAPLIRRQLDTPQWGNEQELNKLNKEYHHHEGVFMDRHLEGILNAVDATAEGQLPSALHEQDRVWLQELARSNKELLQRYALIHDIAKPDTLRIVSMDQGGQQTISELSWDAWQASLPAHLQSGGDEPVSPQAMADYLTEQNVIQISYFQQGKDKGEGKQHGNVGADRVEAFGLAAADVPPFILQAIRKHEVAYQFHSIKVDTFEKHLGSLSEEELKLALAASFLDTMGSRLADGTVDLNAVRALFDSAHNARTIRAAEAIVRLDFTGDPKKLELQLGELRKSTRRIEKAVNNIAAELREKSRPTTYNLTRLNELLETQVIAGTLSAEQSHAVTQAVAEKRLSDLGRVLGKTMSVIKPILAEAEEK